MISKQNTVTYSPQDIVNILDRCIHMVTSNIGCYSRDAISDFTRKRKLPPDVLIRFILQMQAKGTKSELSDYFLSQEVIPSSPAFCQQREKLLPSAFRRLLDLFNNAFQNHNKLKGYYIIACDGSDVNIPFDPDDKETFCQHGSQRPYSQFHVNALYDCLNDIYWDALIDTASKTRECDALKEMILRHRYPDPSIIVADRGYEKYDLMACCIENGQKFIIRVKDKDSNNAILSNVELPKGEFDIRIKRILTRKQTNEVKENPAIYQFISNKTEFTYLDIDHEYYEMEVRVVRFKITDDSYECLITNLEESEFSLVELKEIYHLRWSEETSFRSLKYTVGMLYFHSKKRDFLKQEIYASILLYNVSNTIIKNIKFKEQISRRKYDVKINYSVALTNIRLFLKNLLPAQVLIERIKKILVPIRPERCYERKVKAQSAKPLINRVS